MPAILGANVIVFIGVFIILEALFSIIYYFEGSVLPHVFRAIRTVFGVYLVWEGWTYSLNQIYRSWESLGAQLLLLFVIVALSVLAGYEVADVLRTRDKIKKEEQKNKEEKGKKDRSSEVEDSTSGKTDWF